MRLVPYGLLCIGLRGLSPGGGPAAASAQTPVTFSQAMTMVDCDYKVAARDLALAFAALQATPATHSASAAGINAR